jgi:hypothetical protein
MKPSGSGSPWPVSCSCSGCHAWAGCSWSGASCASSSGGVGDGERHGLLRSHDTFPPARQRHALMPPGPQCWTGKPADVTVHDQLADTFRMGCVRETC